MCQKCYKTYFLQGLNTHAVYHPVLLKRSPADKELTTLQLEVDCLIYYTTSPYSSQKILYAESAHGVRASSFYMSMAYMHSAYRGSVQ
jgi:hypothetical protein